MYNLIYSTYQNKLLKGFSDVELELFEYIINSTPEVMLAYKDEDNKLKLNHGYIVLLVLLTKALGPSRELILNTAHAKDLQRLYELADKTNRNSPEHLKGPSFKLLQLLAGDIWPDILELFTSEDEARSVLYDKIDLVEAMVPIIRKRGTLDSLMTILNSYIPHHGLVADEDEPMIARMQLNNENDLYGNRQLYKLLLHTKPAGYKIELLSREYPFYETAGPALITDSISPVMPWISYTAPQENAYLTFQSDSPFALKVYNNKKNWNGTLYYSTDTTNWNVWSGTSAINSVNNKLYLRGTGNTKITGANSNSYRWVLTGSNIKCIGNIENLLDWETVALGNHPTMARHCYAYLFYGCTALTSAPALPATTLASYCYRNMLAECTALTSAPDLPATTLAEGCYLSMFFGCTALVSAPALPATTLANYCYAYMFFGCESLKISSTPTEVYQHEWRIPTSGTGTEAPNWNYLMLSGTGGTFKSAPSINTAYYLENTPVV